MNVEGSIRKADLSDAEEIATVHVASWQAAYGHILPESVLANLSIQRRTGQWRDVLQRESTDCFVFEVSGRLAGFADFGPPQDDDLKGDPENVELRAIYFRGEHVGKGIGSRLLRHAEGVLKPRLISLWVLERNAGARRFYERNGFVEEVDRRKDYVVSGVAYDALRYVKKLSC